MNATTQEEYDEASHLAQLADAACPDHKPEFMPNRIWLATVINLVKAECHQREMEGRIFMFSVFGKSVDAAWNAAIKEAAQKAPCPSTKESILTLLIPVNKGKEPATANFPCDDMGTPC